MHPVSGKPGPVQALARASTIPLAAGENLMGETAFAAAQDAGALAVIQPDLAKWGGFSGCLPVARRALAAGLRFFPHYLGAGIGLIAAGHLLAAAGGDGRLEVDANENPLRDEVATPLATLRDGIIDLGDAPGLGITPDLERRARFRVRF
ncbi:MAG: hypothetical protein KGL12_04520 [Rhodospirillales bacterium]|nr:hypothetical protein [Rhodospirillales bacterium]